MSSLLRLARTFRPTASSRRPIAPNFFNATPAGLRTGSSPLHQMLRTRLFSSQPAPKEALSTNKKLIYGIIGLNLCVFSYSDYAYMLLKQGFPNSWNWYNQNFSLNLHDVLEHNRYWTTLTACFAHGGMWHICCNMISFYYMAELVASTPTIGPGRFLTIIVGSALTGSAGYLYNQHQRTKETGRVQNQRAVGFSGAVVGLGTVAACMYPRVNFSIWGIVPVPLWALTLSYLAYDSWYLNDPNSRTAHAGHLGGMAFGLLYYIGKIRSFHFRGL